MKRFDEAELYLFPNEMAVNFYVFSSRLCEWLLDYHSTKKLLVDGE
jgi:hypothetical protein